MRVAYACRSGTASPVDARRITFGDAGMTIPNTLSQFTDEADFRDRFVIPLLHRLGFSVVVNYHGQREFGRKCADALESAGLTRLGGPGRYQAARLNWTSAQFEDGKSAGGVCCG